MFQIKCSILQTILYMIYPCSEKTNKIQFEFHKEWVLMLYRYETDST
jgi:hypothetical protein